MNLWSILGRLSYSFCFLLGFLCFANAEENFKCPEQFGYYPDYQDCSKYYVCVFGDSLHEKCTGGLFFSVELQTCDWPRNVECANGEKPGEEPAFDETDDEIFSSSRRNSATASTGRQRTPPSSEPVSNLQHFEQKDDPQNYPRTRPQSNQRQRTTSSDLPSGTELATKQPTVTPATTSRQKPDLNPTTLPDRPSESTPDDAEDPLYLSDERSKVSDPLGNYDPQQPDFDEAAPPLIDSEGGIHIADGGHHGLDAFAGLAHLPGLGDYSVIAKPVYNANGATSDKLAEDQDYRLRDARKPTAGSRNPPAVSTKPRSLENYQSNNGRSKDPDIIVDYNGKDLQWNRQNNQRDPPTPPPPVFDDNADHRDYGRFDIITPLKVNIQADHNPADERRGSSKEAPYEADRSVRVQPGYERSAADRPANRIRYDESGREAAEKGSRESIQEDARSREETSEELRLSVSGEIARLPQSFREDNDRTSLAAYRPHDAQDEGGRAGQPEGSYADENRSQRFPDLPENQRQSNGRNVADENPQPVHADGESPATDPGYRRKPRLNEGSNPYPEILRNNGESKEPDEPAIDHALDANFGTYTGSQRQNRKIEDSSSYNDGSKIVPAESIQPSVRQPNQVHRDNEQKDRVRTDYRPDQPYEEYDNVPPRYGEYDSKPPYTDDYTRHEEETTTRMTTQIVRTRPTRPRKPITTTTTTTTTTTPAPIRIRSRKPISQVTPPTKHPNYYATTPVAPPSRPASLYPTPAPYTSAQKCDPRKCKLPDCRCGGTDVPGGLSVEDIPQLVVLTFDDAVNDLNHDLYNELFNTGRVNPNGCPILGTFYVSHEWTDYGQVQSLYANGHEIASHSITHSYGEKFSKNQWMREIHGQREILHLYGGVKMEDIRGMRAPFLQIGGNKMFEMLYDANFTYDSSMPVYENNPPFWPYTLDYALNHECMIFPCPTKSYPGLWEVGMVMWVDLRGGRCSMGDACSNPPDEEAVTKMLMKNFNRHYKTNKSPFGLFYHSAWFNTQHHRRGFMKFLDEILKNDDVYFVTNWQLIQWMREPTPLSKMKDFEPFNCRRLDRPPPCPSPTVCNVWYQGGVRYMKTCQPCPLKYPWVGSTGYDSKNKG